MTHRFVVFSPSPGFVDFLVLCRRSNLSGTSCTCRWLVTSFSRLPNCVTPRLVTAFPPMDHVFPNSGISLPVIVSVLVPTQRSEVRVEIFFPHLSYSSLASHVRVCIAQTNDYCSFFGLVTSAYLKNTPYSDTIL